jgi:hypothetical protein
MRSASTAKACLHLAAVAGPGRAAGTRHISGDAGHAAAGLRVIPMLRAEVTLNQRCVAALPADLPRRGGPCAALNQGPLRGFGDELLS